MLNMKTVLLACSVDVFLARLGFLLNSNPSLHMVDGYKKDAIVVLIMVTLPANDPATHIQ